MILVASLFHIIIMHEPLDHGPNGIFFCVNGEIEAGDITAALLTGLQEARISDDTQAVSLPEEEYENGFVSY